MTVKYIAKFEIVSSAGTKLEVQSMSGSEALPLLSVGDWFQNQPNTYRSIITEKTFFFQENDTVLLYFKARNEEVLP